MVAVEADIHDWPMEHNEGQTVVESLPVTSIPKCRKQDEQNFGETAKAILERRQGIQCRAGRYK
jgi:hypothetical protein